MLNLFHQKTVIMGKGDQKSRKGKITRGTYGKSRPKKTSKAVVVAKPKPAKAEKVEKVEKPVKAAKPKAEQPAETDEKPKAKKSTKKTEE